MGAPVGSNPTASAPFTVRGHQAGQPALCRTQLGPKALLGVPRVASRLNSSLGLDALAVLSSGSDVRGRGIPATASCMEMALLSESVKSLSELTLSEALRSGRLQDFIAQEEARGIGPVNAKKLDRALRAAGQPTTQKQSANRTSRSPSRDGSRGKRTR